MVSAYCNQTSLRPRMGVRIKVLFVLITPLWLFRHILLDYFHQHSLSLRREIQFLTNGIPKVIFREVLCGICLIVPTLFGEGVCFAIYIDSCVSK